MAARARALSISALASLLHREIPKPKHELLWRRIAVPRDLESSLTVREQRERTARDWLLSVDTDFAAQHSAKRCACVFHFDMRPFRNRVEFERADRHVRFSQRIRLEHVDDVRQLDPNVEPC